MKKPDLRAKRVVFADEKLSSAFARLATATTEERKLHDLIDRALDDLLGDPFCGIKIPQRLWPREYVAKYGINNLWKYDLPNGWRLIYTIKGDAVQIVSIILEWFDHKNYERRFGY